MHDEPYATTANYWGSNSNLYLLLSDEVLMELFLAQKPTTNGEE